MPSLNENTVAAAASRDRCIYLLDHRANLDGRQCLSCLDRVGDGIH